MSWVRSKLRLGTVVALLALAIQFGLSFGHAHPDVAPTTEQIVSLDTASSHGDDDHAGGGRDCGICAVLALAQSALTDTPPTLRLPDAYALLQRIAAAEYAHLRTLAVAYQPRAPPAS